LLELERRLFKGQCGALLWGCGLVQQPLQELFSLWKQAETGIAERHW
jgi:hypothetical protein